MPSHPHTGSGIQQNRDDFPIFDGSIQVSVLESFEQEERNNEVEKIKESSFILGIF